MPKKREEQVKPDDDTGKMLHGDQQGMRARNAAGCTIADVREGRRAGAAGCQPGRSALRMAEVGFAGSNVKCEFQLAQNLSMAQRRPGQIVQVLHNILLNARQAMPDGGVVRVEAANLHVSDGRTTLAPRQSMFTSTAGQRLRHWARGPSESVRSVLHDEGHGTGSRTGTAHAIISKQQREDHGRIDSRSGGNIHSHLPDPRHRR